MIKGIYKGHRFHSLRFAFHHLPPLEDVLCVSACWSCCATRSSNSAIFRSLSLRCTPACRLAAAATVFPWENDQSEIMGGGPYCHGATQKWMVFVNGKIPSIQDDDCGYPHLWNAPYVKHCETSPNILEFWWTFPVYRGNVFDNGNKDRDHRVAVKTMVYHGLQRLHMCFSTRQFQTVGFLSWFWDLHPGNCWVWPIPMVGRNCAAGPVERSPTKG